jgi:uncharacterized protein (DUF924 family)
MTIDEQADAVLNFWLEETPADKRFARDDALDEAIRERFGPLQAALSAGLDPGWWSAPRPLLAAIIVLDQFSRNLHRGHAAAFATDDVARDLARYAVARAWQVGMTAAERQFLFMPFMHSEAMADQRLAVALFEALGEPVALDFARRHMAQVERFGRFPQRNAALGRDSSAAELEFMAQPGATF